jgi:MFS family permease
MPETTAPAAPGGAPGRPAIHRTVIVLGVTSLLTDVSSEMIVPVFPLFVVGTLGASVASLGLIEGIAESTASLLRIVSGRWSDASGRRTPFLVGGYGLSAIAKAAFAFAMSWPVVLGLRFTDRLGKAMRNPPRDALIADVTADGDRGRAFGLHRAMDTFGAALGPLAAWAVLQWSPGDFRRVFLVSAIPALLAVLVLVMLVRAPRAHRSPVPAAARDARPPLGRRLRRFLVADGVFQLGNSSMAFVLMRASDAGLAAGLLPLAYLLYNLVYAALAYPVGALADRIGRRRLLVAAYLVYAATYAMLAAPLGGPAAIAAFVALGLHSALIEVSQRSMIADLAPAERRATAYGIYHTVVGVALLPASIVAGVLWERVSHAAPFALGAALALGAAMLFLLLLPPGRESTGGTAMAH